MDYEKIGNDILKKRVKFIPFTEVLDRAIEELDATDPKEIISFGYRWLDDKMTGLFKGELVIIGGETGTGKTTFATNIIYKASAKHKCAVLALEDRLPDYGIRALYFEIGRIRKRKGWNNYPWNAYRRNEIDDTNYKELRAEAYENIKNSNIFFGDVEELMDIDMLEAAMKEQVDKGVKLFLIDHLHYFDLMRGDSTKSDYVEQVMIRMKRMLDKTGVAAILVVHYKKLDGFKPKIDSFKDSIAIAQNANYVINLWRDRSLKEGEELWEGRYDTKVFVPKSRNPNGEFTVDVVFDPAVNDFKNPQTSYGGTEDSESQSKIDSL